MRFTSKQVRATVVKAAAAADQAWRRARRRAALLAFVAGVLAGLAAAYLLPDVVRRCGDRVAAVIGATGEAP